MTVLYNTRSIKDDSWGDYLRGAASVFNLSGRTRREYNFSTSPAEADCIAICNDWAAVSGDLETALEGYGLRVYK